MNKLGRLAFIIFGAGVFYLSTAAGVHALSTDHFLRVTVQNDGSAWLAYQVTLTASEQEQLVSGWSGSLPFAGLREVTANLNGAIVPSTFDGTTINVSFQNLSLRAGSTGILTVTGFAPNVLHDEEQFPYLAIPKINVTDPAKTKNTEVIYPANLSGRVFSNAVIDSGARGARISDLGGIFIYWIPENLNVEWKQSYQLEDTGVQAVPMPKIRAGQAVIVTKTNGAEHAGKDAWDNVWALGASTQIDYTAYLQLNSVPSSVQFTNHGCQNFDGLTLPEGNVAFLRALQYLKSKVGAQASAPAEPINIDTVKQKLTEGGEMSKLELACGLAGILDSLGVKSEIVYGYYLLPDNELFGLQGAAAWVET